MLIRKPYLFRFAAVPPAALATFLLSFCQTATAQQPSASAAAAAAPHGSRAVSVLSGLSDDLQNLSHSIEPSVVKIYAAGLAPVSEDNQQTSYLAQQRVVGSGAGIAEIHPLAKLSARCVYDVSVR